MPELRRSSSMDGKDGKTKMMGGKTRKWLVRIASKFTDLQICIAFLAPRCGKFSIVFSTSSFAPIEPT